MSVIRTLPSENEGGSHSPRLRGFCRQFLIRWQYILVAMKEWLRGEGGVIVCMAIYVVVSTHVICDRFGGHGKQRTIINRSSLRFQCLAATPTLSHFCIYSGIPTLIPHLRFLSVVSKGFIGVILLLRAWIIQSMLTMQIG